MMLNPKEMSIEEIRKKVEELGQDVPPDFLALLKKDSRLGVKKLIQTHLNKKKEQRNKIEHLEELAGFDKAFKHMVIGVDEAGRGPLAGPVVACAVMLDLDNVKWAVEIDDSKKITRKKRQDLCVNIKDKALFCSVGIVQADTIDQINILNATHLAMEKAVEGSSEHLLRLVDGLFVPCLGKKQQAVVKGDAKSLSIAAASIVAKETRDQIMDEWDKLYPEYGFCNHKGYGTKDHYAALEKHGLCPIHRKSFLKNFELKQGVLF